MYILAMSKAGGTIGMLLWIIVLFGFMYFFMARPPVSYTHLDVYKRQSAE